MDFIYLYVCPSEKFLYVLCFIGSCGNDQKVNKIAIGRDLGKD